jgi:hypothetical protein
VAFSGRPIDAPGSHPYSDLLMRTDHVVGSGVRAAGYGVVFAWLLGVLAACAPDATSEVASDTRAVTVAAIPRGSVWRAWDRGGDLGSAWRGGFDDSTWTSGPGPLGYGETYLKTTLGFGPSATSKYITTYFRRSFTVDDPAAITAITGEVMYDDGIVVYLNGTRIGRDSMPSGAISAATLALGHEANNRIVRRSGAAWVRDW